MNGFAQPQSQSQQNPLLQSPRTFTQLEAWKDFVRDSFPWLELHRRPGSAFRAHADGRVVDRSLVMGVAADASQAVRTRRLAEATEVGYLKLFWQFRGRTQLRQDDRCVTLSPGTVSVCDVARPYIFRMGEDADFAVMLLPYEACPGWVGISQQLCARSLTHPGSANAALGALAGLAGTPRAATDVGAGDVFRAVEWLLSGCLHRAAAGLRRRAGGAAADDVLGTLTQCELGVLEALRRGWSNEVIAAEKSVSVNTVKFHLKNIYRKLGVRGRMQAAETARRML